MGDSGASSGSSIMDVSVRVPLEYKDAFLKGNTLPKRLVYQNANKDRNELTLLFSFVGSIDELSKWIKRTCKKFPEGRKEAEKREKGTRKATDHPGSDSNPVKRSRRRRTISAAGPRVTVDRVSSFHPDPKNKKAAGDGKTKASSRRRGLAHGTRGSSPPREQKHKRGSGNTGSRARGTTFVASNQSAIGLDKRQPDRVTRKRSLSDSAESKSPFLSSAGGINDNRGSNKKKGTSGSGGYKKQSSSRITKKSNKKSPANIGSSSAESLGDISAGHKKHDIKTGLNRLFIGWRKDEEQSFAAYRTKSHSPPASQGETAAARIANFASAGIDPGNVTTGTAIAAGSSSGSLNATGISTGAGGPGATSTGARAGGDSLGSPTSSEGSGTASSVGLGSNDSSRPPSARGEANTGGGESGGASVAGGPWEKGDKTEKKRRDTSGDDSSRRRRGFLRALFFGDEKANSASEKESTKAKSNSNIKEGGATRTSSAMMLNRDEFEKARIIRYEDLTEGEIIGAGAFTKVMKARYRGTPVAVKEAIPDQMPGYNSDEFDREVSLLSCLSHPNIVQFIGACFKPELIILEYCDRGSLQSVIRTQPELLTLERTVSIMMDTARGMAYLQTLDPPIIHRDMKSANVLLTRGFVAKVCDFGVSRQMRKCDWGAMTMGVGTTRWTAPEVYSDNNYSTKADVYSFSIVLWECLAKSVPFSHVRFDYLVEDSVLSGERPDVSSTWPAVLVDQMKACWAQDPSERPEFMEIAAAFERISENDYSLIRMNRNSGNDDKKDGSNDPNNSDKGNGDTATETKGKGDGPWQKKQLQNQQSSDDLSWAGKKHCKGSQRNKKLLERSEEDGDFSSSLSSSSSSSSSVSFSDDEKEEGDTGAGKAALEEREETLSWARASSSSSVIAVDSSEGEEESSTDSFFESFVGHKGSGDERHRDSGKKETAGEKENTREAKEKQEEEEEAKEEDVSVQRKKGSKRQDRKGRGEALSMLGSAFYRTETKESLSSNRPASAENKKQIRCSSDIAKKPSSNKKQIARKKDTTTRSQNRGGPSSSSGVGKKRIRVVSSPEEIKSHRGKKVVSARERDHSCTKDAVERSEHTSAKGRGGIGGKVSGKKKTLFGLRRVDERRSNTSARSLGSDNRAKSAEFLNNSPCVHKPEVASSTHPQNKDYPKQRQKHKEEKTTGKKKNKTKTNKVSTSFRLEDAPPCPSGNDGSSSSEEKVT